jgi:hypothetical protein
MNRVKLDFSDVFNTSVRRKKVVDYKTTMQVMAVG